MNFRKVWLVLFLLLFLLPIETSAQTQNAGFVPGSIWYSKDPFEEGDKIKIYTLIFNPDKRELSGTVLFFDKTTLLGKKDFAIATQTAKDLSINWTVDAGSHSIRAEIQNAKFLLSPGKYEAAKLAESETKADTRTVSKKIIPGEAGEGESKTAATGGASFESIKNLGTSIEEYTPDFIANPIVLGASFVEDFRVDTGATTENKKAEVQAEIKTLEEKKTPESSEPAKESNVFLKPFKYVELFFLSIASFLLNNKILFYIILFALVALILRFIWNKIF